MAEKRTPPDPAESVRPRKRLAPTIDLTATEVSGPSANEAQPIEAVSESQSAEDREPDAAAASEGSSQERTVGSSPIAWQILLAGCVGAAIMTAALLTLWFAGMVPDRYAGSSSGDSTSIAVLNERMERIEASLARLSVIDPNVSERLSATDNALKSVGVALAALNKRSDDAAAATTEARAGANAAAVAVDELQKRVAALEQSARTAREAIAKTGAADAAVRLALSAAALRDAVLSGRPFIAELAEAKLLGDDGRVVAALEPFSAGGVPTAQALTQELHALVPGMMKASGLKASGRDLLERIEASVGKLIRIRPVDAPPGHDTSAVLSRVEIESSRGDIDGALADISRLDPATRATVQDWVARAQARQAALTAARQFAAETARAIGKR